MIDRSIFDTLQGLTTPRGKVIKVEDESGRVLWSATIKFTINGDTYIADRGMTWAEWFASNYNTTGKTVDDVQSISANGATIELGTVIVGGTAYEVGFATDPVITIIGDGSYNSFGTTKYAATITIDGTEYHSDGEITVPVGTTITLGVMGNAYQYQYYPGIVYLNGQEMFISQTTGWTMDYVDYVVQGNVSIRIEKDYITAFGAANYYAKIYITEL